MELQDGQVLDTPHSRFASLVANQLPKIALQFNVRQCHLKINFVAIILESHNNCHFNTDLDLNYLPKRFLLSTIISIF